MSELSSLSHEYAASALFAENLNAAVLKLKKSRFQTPGMTALSPKDLEEARETVAKALEALLAELDPTERAKAPPEDATRSIPEEVVERVQKRYQPQFHYFREDLKKGIAVLHSGKELDEGTFQVIDNICDLADATASTAFRRLWRR